MIKLIAILLLCYCFTANSINAQSNKEAEIEQIKLNLKLAKTYYTTNRKKGKELAELVYKESNKYPETITELIDVHNLLGLFATYNDEPEKAMFYFKEGNALALKNKNEPLRQKIQTNIGNLYMNNGKYKEAIEHLFSLLKTLQNNKQATANSLANIANCYSYLGEDSLAIKYQLEAMPIFEEVKDKRGIGTGYNLLGVSYKYLKNFSLSNNYLSKALAIKIENNDTSGILNATTNIGTNYYQNNDYDNCIKTFRGILQMAETYNSNMHLSALYMNMAVYFDKMNVFDSSNYYDKKAYSKVFKTNNLYLQTNLLLNISRTYEKMNMPDSAFRYITKAIKFQDSLFNINKQKQIAEIQTKYETEKKELTINLLSRQDSIKTLQIANQQLDIKSGLLLLAQKDLGLARADLQLVEDSLLIQNTSQELLRKKIQVQQNEERINLLHKEKKIQALLVKQKNNTIIGIAIGFVLLLLAGLFYFKNYQLQKKKEIQEQIHAQQLKATIDILTAEEMERKRIAGDLHDGIGQTMMAAWLNLQGIQNNTLSSQEKEHLLQKAILLVDESCKEVRAVSHNMMPNALLKKGLVNAVKEFIQQIDDKILTINVHSEGLYKALPSVTETIVYRVIQESVNNVIKHSKATLLDISILNEVDGIDILIEDNGKGFNVLEALQHQGGLGLQNIKSRIEYLKGTVDWSSSSNNGTLVAIHIPL